MSDLVTARPANIQEALPLISQLTDVELDQHIATTEKVDILSRFLRIERGRRTTKRHGQGKRNDLVTSGVTKSDYERKRRSEEMLVAQWADNDPTATQHIQDWGWNKCVREARQWRNNQQPTLQDPTPKHPAKFSDPILPVINEALGPDVKTVLDPFAGTGKIHELENRETTGIEIEPEWADQHPDTQVGNALDLQFPDATFDAVATSPTYGNRLADNHDAKDGSTRRSYTHDLGHKLHKDNSGDLQWGDEYREFHRKAWAEAVRVIKPGGKLVLNISDHIRNHKRVWVHHFHFDVLKDLGLKWVNTTEVKTPRHTQGENATARVDTELVITFERPA